MKKILLLLLPILAVVGLAQSIAGATSAAGRTGFVVGMVSAHGAPAAGAAVMLEVVLPDGRMWTAHARSDHRGHFRFRDVPAGLGVARARHPRGGHDEVRYLLAPDGVARVHLQLHR